MTAIISTQARGGALPLDACDWSNINPYFHERFSVIDPNINPHLHEKLVISPQTPPLTTQAS